MPINRHAAMALFALLSITADAAAQTIHKCREKGGAIRYQDMPCSATQRPLWAREYAVPPALEATAANVPETKTMKADTRRSHPRASARKRVRTPHAPQGTLISLHRDAKACRAAKARRERTYLRLGLRRDFDTSRRMDDMVSAACR